LSEDSVTLRPAYPEAHLAPSGYLVFEGTQGSDSIRIGKAAAIDYTGNGYAVLIRGTGAGAPVVGVELRRHSPPDAFNEPPKTDPITPVAGTPAGPYFRVRANENDWYLVAAEVKKLLVLCNGGDDLLRIDRSVRVPMQLVGGDGNDTILGGSRGCTIYGDYTGNLINGAIGESRGNDYLVGSTGSDWINGGVWSDVIDGKGGNDTLIGGPPHAFDENTTVDNEADTISGGAGNDSIDGGGGDDYLSGGDGTDTIQGGDGADVLIGGRGPRDQLIGGAGDDHFSSADGAGNADSLWGGEGFDRLMSPADADDVFMRGPQSG
jgi:Ca2+-binding RTX toxin-like protein